MMAKGKNRTPYCSIPIPDWNCFLEVLNYLKTKVKKEEKDNWLFRGQSSDRPLKTSLERALDNYGINLKKALDLENRLIKEFRRRYDGADGTLVESDISYCLSLMRHHGAPTRQLDFNYSPYIALFFCLEEGYRKAKKTQKGCPDDYPPVVWCVRSNWCKKHVDDLFEKEGIAEISDKRNEEEDDQYFRTMYLREENLKPFVFPENPYHLNKRLVIQQGVFLCPGDITTCFEENLTEMHGYDSEENIIKLEFAMTKDKYEDALIELHRMNINRASLFPGLDGFAESLKTKLLILKDL